MHVVGNKCTNQIKADASYSDTPMATFPNTSTPDAQMTEAPLLPPLSSLTRGTNIEPQNQTPQRFSLNPLDLFRGFQNARTQQPSEGQRSCGGLGSPRSNSCAQQMRQVHYSPRALSLTVVVHCVTFSMYCLLWGTKPS